MIIWDEYKYGKQVFESNSVNTKKWQTNELRSLIKYILTGDKNNTTSDVKEKLDLCCTDEIKYLTKKQKTNIFNKLISQCYDGEKNIKIIRDNNVIVYINEIEKIKSLSNKNMELLVFVLLIYSKWLGLEWFSISKSDLQKESKTANLNQQKLQDLLSDLFEKEFIKSDVIKLDKHERRKEKIMKKQMWSIDWLQTEGEVAFEFHNYINFAYRYLDYVYGGYFECDVCGGMFSQNKKNNKHICNNCSKYIPIETKTIICIDCGEEVPVDSKDNETCRCDKHREKHLKEIKKQQNKRYYKSKNNCL